MAQNVLRTHSRSRSFTALAAGGSMLTAGAGVGTLATALFIGLAGPAGATTLTVSNTLDSGAGSLRQAMINANAAAGADTINFASGVTGTITLASDLPDVTESLTITGPGSAALTISGAGIHHAFALHTVNNGAVTISGLTITNSVGTAATGLGGAIDAIDTPVSLDDIDANHNSVDSSHGSSTGGAIWVRNQVGTGNVTIKNSVLSQNLSSSSGAGNTALHVGGAILIADQISLTNTKIDHNDGPGVGGLVASARVALTMVAATISNNAGKSTIGGIAALSDSLTIADSVISGNTSDGIGGAYMFGRFFEIGVTNTGGGGSYGGATPPNFSVTNTRISDNTGADVGGALLGWPMLYSDQSTILDRLTVTGNANTNHNEGKFSAIGGLLVGGPTTISNSTIADNTGSGISVWDPYGATSLSTSMLSSGPALTPSATVSPVNGGSPINFENTLTISHSTITGNSLQGIATTNAFIAGSTPTNVSPTGQGPINFKNTVTLDHVLAANNGVEDVALPATATFSLIETPNASLIAGTGTVTGVDPGLLPLQDVSDTVSVVPIAMGSAAWNAGNPNFTPPPATDQRGLPRVVDIIDIGAYEVQEQLIFPKFTG